MATKGRQKRVNKSRAAKVVEMASSASRSRKSRAAEWEPSEIQYGWYVLWTAEQWPLRRIAASAKRSVSAVYKTVLRVQTWEFDAMVEHRMTIARSQTQALRRIYVQAEESYQRSLQSAVTIKTEEIELIGFRGDGDTVPAVKTTRTEVGQAGDAALLNVKLKVLQDIRTIWGVDAPKELKHSGESGPATSLIPITAPNRREAIRQQLLASLEMLDKQSDGQAASAE